MNVLILGATGMIGHTLFKVLNASAQYEVFGTLRDPHKLDYFPEKIRSRLIVNRDILDQDALIALLNQVKPQVIINATGVVKQLSEAHDPLVILPMNALFPHQLAAICAFNRIRLIQMSTDCVFLGTKGGYVEEDVCDAQDLYGQSKAIGEVKDASHVLTLRTSTIGHELGSHHGLLEWFLSEQTDIGGFANAIFSGVVTVELARIIRDFVLPNPTLSGLYHVSSSPINKYDLLNLIANVYQHPIGIRKDTSFVIDRSLNSLRFIQATGYTPLPWDTQIDLMYQSR